MYNAMVLPLESKDNMFRALHVVGYTLGALKWILTGLKWSSSRSKQRVADADLDGSSQS